MKKMKIGKMKGHKHTGAASHKGMGSLLTGHGSKDPHADAMHHQLNNAHGMPEGMSPVGGFDEGPGAIQPGGAGMSENGESCCQ
jgi:hypothetical protein